VTVTSKSLPALISSATYAFRGGFLIRPFIIALALGAAGAVFSWLEEDVPAIGSLDPVPIASRSAGCPGHPSRSCLPVD
jgi:hypothetical protein